MKRNVEMLTTKEIALNQNVADNAGRFPCTISRRSSVDLKFLFCIHSEKNFLLDLGFQIHFNGRHVGAFLANNSSMHGSKVNEKNGNPSSYHCLV